MRFVCKGFRGPEIPFPSRGGTSQPTNGIPASNRTSEKGPEGGCVVEAGRARVRPGGAKLREAQPSVPCSTSAAVRGIPSLGQETVSLQKFLFA